ncbi:MAG: transglycosylase SLT domain-containing protein [Bacteroidales bacterium]|nr:transglycosylase SLT domain-containing protein [Bacteroidales bacterium]
MKSLYGIWTFIIYLLCTVAALFVVPFQQRDSLVRINPLDHDKHTLECAIRPGDDFNYIFLGKFSSDLGLECRINRSADDILDSLRSGALDLAALGESVLESGLGDSLVASRRFGDSTVWVFREGPVERLRFLNSWLTATERSRYYGRVARSLRHRKGDPGQISPYDSLIKVYASRMGWDWRLLASVIYHESRFSMSAASNRGAIGLMQVVPNHYSADSLMDPSTNLQAGTNYLLKLENMFRSSSADSLECVKFAVAAYNAGEGRIKNCLKFALEKNVDATKWDNVVELFPEMEDFDGRQTAAYVDGVISTWYAYMMQYN